MAHHDHSYKLLFSHPQMVRDLLEGFVCKEWLAGLDYASLERVSSEYVSDKLRSRSSDVVWRLRRGAEWIYLYLLLEFQSTVEHYMAVRILTYVGHLYQDLIRSRQLPENGYLPEVLPIVLYNGERAWRAPRDLAPLIARCTGRGARYRPNAHYLLIDERRVRTNELGSSKNLAAVLFQIENSTTENELRTIVGSLRELLRDPEHAELRRAFSVWISKVILPRFRGTPGRSIEDLEETYSMLTETIKKWQAGYLREGREQGRHEGEVAMLLQVLRVRFGRLPAGTRQRLMDASSDQLKQWCKQLRTARRLEDVLEEDVAHSE